MNKYKKLKKIQSLKIIFNYFLEINENIKNRD